MTRQEQCYDIKINRTLNPTNPSEEFARLYSDLASAFDSYVKGKSDIDVKLGEAGMYLLAISEMFGIDLEDAINKRVDYNLKRKEFLKLIG